jgi:hypothetical protein
MKNFCPEPLEITEDDVEIKKVDQANSLVRVRVRQPCYLRNEFTADNSEAVNPPLLLVVGNRVYGYSDAPLQRDAHSISALLPTSLLMANPRIQIKSLFQRSGASVSIIHKFGDVAAESPYLLSQTERMVFLGQNASDSTYEFLLYGNRLSGVTFDPVIQSSHLDQDTLMKIKLTAAQLNTQKYLVLQRPDGRAFTVQIPSVDAKESGPDLKIERLVVGTDSVIVKGDGLKDLTKVTFNDIVLPIDKGADGKSVTLKELVKKEVTTTPTTKTLVFWFNDKKVEVKLEVVNTKVENVQK